MLKLPLLLAALAGEPLAGDPLPGSGTSNFFSANLRDILLISGVALALSLILYLWAYITRRDRQRHAATQRGARAIYRSERGASHHHTERRGRSRKRRRKNPDMLRRNPTLAEAGGLPPLRADEPEAPPETEPSPPPSSPAP